MPDKIDKHDFGCAACWMHDALSTRNALSNLPIETYLVDESHFIVSIRRCKKCSQLFLSVFTEVVDFLDGDDPQYRIILPITAQEARALRRGGENLSLAQLGTLAPNRRSLHYNHPKGEEEITYWGTGVKFTR